MCCACLLDSAARGFHTPLVAYFSVSRDCQILKNVNLKSDAAALLAVAFRDTTAVPQASSYGCRRHSQRIATKNVLSCAVIGFLHFFVSVFLCVLEAWTMEVIWLLDGAMLSGLRRATQRSSGGGGGAAGRARVSLEVFVTEFYRALCFGSGSSDHGAKGRSQAKTRQLIERICVLFDLVDVDSAGVIDWVDFTDFCVYIRGRDSGNQGLEEESGAPTTEQKRVQDSEITRFTEKLGYIDRSSHCHEVGADALRK